MIIKIFEFQKFFFLKLKVLLVAKYHRKSFALTSLISSQWAFKKNSNFSGKKIEKSKIPHNFPQGWPGTVLLHQRVYTNGTSQKKNILSILAILSYHPLVYFCPGEPLNYNCIALLQYFLNVLMPLARLLAYLCSQASNNLS